MLREAGERGLVDSDALTHARRRARGRGPQGARHHGAARADGVRAARAIRSARILPVVVESGPLALAGDGRGPRRHRRHPARQGPAAPHHGARRASASTSASTCARRCSCRSPSASTCCSRSSGATATTWRSWSMSTAASPGLCTIEDVIEQIVGEIDDEFDVEDDQNIRRDAERQFTVRGVTRIDEFNEYFGAQLSEEEGVDTIAGLRHEAARAPAAPRRERQHRRLRVPRAARGSPPHRCAARDGAARRAAPGRARPRRRQLSRMLTAPDTAAAAPAAARYRLSPPQSCALRAAARRRGGPGARRLIRAAEPVAAGGAGPGAAHVAVAGRGRRARRRASGSGSAPRTFAAGTYWLYVSIHVMGQAPVWLAFVLMLGLAGIMGLYHAALGYAVRPLAAAARRPALAGRAARGVAAAGVVARLVPVGVLVAVARLLADGHLARRLRAARRRLRHQRAAAGVRRRARRARAAAPAASGSPALIVLLLPWGAGAALYRHSWTQRVRRAGVGGGHPGRDPAGREVAREQSRHDAQSLPVAHREGPRHAAHRVAGVRARRHSPTTSCRTSPSSTARRTRTARRS